MVRGANNVDRKFRALPEMLLEEVRRELEVAARSMVAQMRAIVPKRSGALAASIGYTFGTKVPSGAIKIGSVRSSKAARIAVTIYAGNEAAFYARFVEFGTAPHSLATNASTKRGLRQDQGGQHPGATAQPFFFPTYRANRDKVRNQIRAAARRAARRASEA